MDQKIRPFARWRAALAGLAIALAASGMLVTGPVSASAAPTTLRTGTLDDISCLGPSFCMAMGSFGPKGSPLVEQWNGTAWRVLPSPGAGGGSISCTSRTFCMALAFDASVRWNGSRWHRFPSAALASMTALTCASRTFCIAVGGGSGGEQNVSAAWNGTAWRKLPTPDTGCVPFCGLARVSCSSAKGCMAVGSTLNDAGETGTAAAITWNGKAWAVHDAPSPGFDAELSGVSCVRGLRCTAVGGYTTDNTPCPCALVVHWNGTSWRQITPTFSGTPTAVSCGTARDCVAVGGALVLVEQTGAWTQDTVTAPGGATPTFNSVSCWSASACIAVGHYVTSKGAQLTLAERWNGTTWTVLHTWTPS